MLENHQISLPHHASERESPKRWQAFVFHLKTHCFQVRRWFTEIGNRPLICRKANDYVDAPILAEKRAPLWKGVSAQEFPLTAGKVENLRIAANVFHGLEVPPGAVLSFWRQMGRTTRRKGYRNGRELREGCIVPAIGGGLCQLSGLLYQAALSAGLEIIERHGHSRIIPGSQAEQNLDATVFWNYVDLRFRSHFPWRMETELTPSELIVRIRVLSDVPPQKAIPHSPAGTPRALPSGDCLTCGMISCFRHPSAIKENAPSLGHSTFLLDSRWPEFDRWCGEHARSGDRWFTPMDGKKWRKPNYQWSVPNGKSLHHATLAAFQRSWRQRRLPSQGSQRQRTLISCEKKIAHTYAKMLDPQCRHLVISQNLLPHLWQLGVLGGRTFDVLLERWPLHELQRRLDEAHSANAESSTLADFRADEDLVRAEKQALAVAGRIITPHLALAEHFASRAWLIDWEMPKPLPRGLPNGKPLLFFPASRLGRKGAYELATALQGVDATLCYLGLANEGGVDPFADIPCYRGTTSDLANASALILPAWIEHQPRLALLALASGIPVIASKACGLPPHEKLFTIPSPDAIALAKAIRDVFASICSQHVA
jgi:hypothetical protein